MSNFPLAEKISDVTQFYKAYEQHHQEGRRGYRGGQKGQRGGGRAAISDVVSASYQTRTAVNLAARRSRSTGGPLAT